MERSDGGAGDGQAPWGEGGRGAVTPRKSDLVETTAISVPRRLRCGVRRWGDCGGGEASQSGDRILARLLPSFPRCFPPPMDGGGGCVWPSWPGSPLPGGTLPQQERTSGGAEVPQLGTRGCPAVWICRLERLEGNSRGGIGLAA
ncbi:hypothetical protein NDU88_005477 [Pleurodeles waltl]|uniref:Uncharacterized protein n=1 Tax=Pleurodeles waltl TaxID=8319 RepID=A0AAV7PFI4_PLEWA|nr:hypothetical protein NDU88_005477 [Pleurodeles waltl]